jgi:hypothetical protein
VRRRGDLTAAIALVGLPRLIALPRIAIVGPGRGRQETAQRDQLAQPERDDTGHTKSSLHDLLRERHPGVTLRTIVEVFYLRRPALDLLQSFVMKNRTLGLCVTGLALAACACGSSKTCTLMGCQDQLILEISQSSGLAVLFSARLDIDGRAVACPAPARGESTTCDTGVSIASRELQDCTQTISGGQASETCVGTGYFTERIIILGAPKSVDITLMTGATVVAQTTIAPTYEVNQPNGPGCDPVCKQAAATWTPL